MSYLHLHHRGRKITISDEFLSFLASNDVELREKMGKAGTSDVFVGNRSGKKIAVIISLDRDNGLLEYSQELQDLSEKIPGFYTYFYQIYDVLAFNGEVTDVWSESGLTSKEGSTPKRESKEVLTSKRESKTMLKSENSIEEDAALVIVTEYIEYTLDTFMAYPTEEILRNMPALRMSLLDFLGKMYACLGEAKLFYQGLDMKTIGITENPETKEYKFKILHVSGDNNHSVYSDPPGIYKISSSPQVNPVKMIENFISSIPKLSPHSCFEMSKL